MYYRPPPTREEIQKEWIPKLQNLKDAKSKGRPRWKSKKRIYEWDFQHEELEIYDNKGKHLGHIDPKTGKEKKPQNRKIDP